MMYRVYMIEVRERSLPPGGTVPSQYIHTHSTTLPSSIYPTYNTTSEREVVVRGTAADRSYVVSKYAAPMFTVLGASTIYGQDGI